MTRQDAIQFVADNILVDTREYTESLLEDGSCGLVQLRNEAYLLPEQGYDGSLRVESDWAFLDMFAKLDTGIYGAVYYFKSMEKKEVWVEEVAKEKETREEYLDLKPFT